MTAAATPAAKSGLIRSSLLLSGLTLISRFMGLARDLVLTARLGASATIAADAYYTALAFPNLFRRIFAEGAFSSAFIPSYTKTLTGEGQAEADRIASDALATLAAATIAITLAAQLAMPWLMYVINPGYASDPAKFKLAIVLTQISMPYLPCMAIGALLSGVLNAHRRFIITGIFPTILNLVMLIAVIPQDDPILAAYAASIAIPIAGVFQAALLWWGARKCGAHIRVRWPSLTPEIKALIALAVPGAIAASAVQINIFISGILASQVAGGRAWTEVAARLYQLPLGLIGVAVSVALLPRLSSAIQAKDHDDAQAATDQAVIFSLALTAPAAAALIAMPFFLIDGLFTRGVFTAEDARQTGWILLNYGWGVPAFVLARVLQPAFFARSDTKAPMRFGLISVAVNIVLGLALFQVVGVKGIAAATSAAAWINVVQMVLLLAKRGDYSPTKAAWSRIGRIVAASTVFGALLAFASHERAWLEAPLRGFHLIGLGAKEIAVLGVAAVGVAVYGLLLLAFRGITPSEIKTALRRRPGDAVVSADL
ncbi:murein biosynthesis integral membrane protein MurJ [Phenylobacterium sp. 58.2.17]|uniref:murein biosynthesis integral membrane protein MurJ n=1 Tax=Phenylobacterium sp. 58.2.17 TaxID=2969306 RepID=UPI0022645E9F|nr:murein biosynthesis integral membrane protein MurJ [Phenylobacterium sp. 58.2.17]MCX7588487.1 murein biosynthesis integral membrane protein MurJ [Phenylobacterium sp. 58.2.17]